MSYSELIRTPQQLDTFINVLVWVEKKPKNKPFGLHFQKEIVSKFSDKPASLKRLLFHHFIDREPGSFYIKGEKSHTYKVNVTNFDAAITWLELKLPNFNIPDTAVKSEEDKWDLELRGVRQFKLDLHEDCYRRFHPVLGLKREIKNKLFKNWLDFDVESAAFTTILQLYSRWSTNKLRVIPKYLTYKQMFRLYVAELIDVDLSVAKQILTAIFNGAKLTNWSSLAKLQSMNEGKVFVLKNDDVIHEFNEERKRVWKLVAKQWKERCKEVGGQPLKKGQNQFIIYFQCELIIQNAMIKFAKQNKLDFFPEHDGIRLRTKDKLIKQDLEAFIKQSTPFDVKLAIKF